jgi:hypothetical protein
MLIAGNASGGFVGGKLRGVTKPTLFETFYAVQRQLRLFELATVFGDPRCYSRRSSLTRRLFRKNL